MEGTMTDRLAMRTPSSPLSPGEPCSGPASGSSRRACVLSAALVWALLAVVGAALFGPVAAPLEAKKSRAESKADEEAVAALPTKYRAWIAEVTVLISDEELDAFLTLAEDYQRDAFIERFWRARDPYPGTARNEFRDRFEERLSRARASFEGLDNEQARFYLINGDPAGVRKLECGTLLWPSVVWFYAGSETVPYEFFVVWYRRYGTGPYRLWDSSMGLKELFQDAFGVGGGGNNYLLQQIQGQCLRGDEVAAILASIVQQGFLAYAQVLADAREKPEPPRGEWVETFNAYSTDLPADAKQLSGKLALTYPGRRQSRTAVQGVLTVPKAEAGKVVLGEYASYNFVLTGEVLAPRTAQRGEESEEELFDTFRYKFDFPAVEPAAGGEPVSETDAPAAAAVGAAPDGELPMVFNRYLRPGSYRLILKLEDLNAGSFLRIERDLEVPEVAAGPPPPPDPETARLVAEANAALLSGDTTLQLVEPAGELLSGMRRIETLTTGADAIDRVAFLLDGEEILVKTRPPYSVELDLGDLPRPRTLEAVAFDGAGKVLASDEILLNASRHRFAVRLAQPRRGETYVGSLTARAEVDLPEGRSVERVELFLNEDRVATLYQPPFEQTIVLPGSGELSYVQAVAYLPDGNSTQDLVFINAPDLVLDEVDIDFVELYTTVLDKEGRPVTGLAAGDFRVAEDGVAQEIRRFERVEDRPIHAEVLLDVSASMDEEDRLPQARDAALGFLEQIITPKDRAALITFNDRPNLAVKMTSDLTDLASGLTGLKAERGTALYDSLIFGLYYFNGITGQRTMLVLSDGKDESSRFAFEDALEYARRAGVTIYTIGLDLPKGDARRQLDRLAEETGGRSYFIEQVGELPAIYSAIEEELRSQYLIAYQSSNTSKSDDFRFIEVEVTARPEGKKLEAKTLRGYYP